MSDVRSSAISIAGLETRAPGVSSLTAGGQSGREARGARRIRLIAALCIALGAGCASEEPLAELGQTQGALISDQLHAGSTNGFFWLSPVVPRPAPFGDIIADANPTVRIDRINPTTGASLETIATFTREKPAHGEWVRLKLRGQPCDADDNDGDDDPEGYFVVRWKTDAYNLNPSATYRIHVLTPDGRELGFADVDVVVTQKQFKGVDREEYVPLIEGKRLRIKFRIDRPAVDRDGDGALDWRDNCPDLSNPDQLDSDGDQKGDACECMGVVCGAIDGCHAAGVCSPATGVCSNPAVPAGTVCRDSVGECDVAETCTPTGVCPPDGFAAVGTACGSSESSECDGPDLCDGAGVCGPNHALPGASCQDGSGCTTDDTCQDGACAGGPVRVCNDGTLCTEARSCEVADEQQAAAEAEAERLRQEAEAQAAAEAEAERQRHEAEAEIAAWLAYLTPIIAEAAEQAELHAQRRFALTAMAEELRAQATDYFVWYLAEGWFEAAAVMEAFASVDVEGLAARAMEAGAEQDLLSGTVSDFAWIAENLSEAIAVAGGASNLLAQIQDEDGSARQLVDRAWTQVFEELDLEEQVLQGALDDMTTYAATQGQPQP